MIEPIVERGKIPGMVAVLLNSERIIAEGIAGVRKRCDSAPITTDDQFLLCSATKAMTATLAAIAVEEGKLAWSSTLGASLPDLAAHMHPDWKAVTLAQLLARRAGVPGTGESFWTSLQVHFSSASEKEKRRDVVTKILSRTPNYPPGSRYVYADIDYVIVGAMLEDVFGRSWEDLMLEKIWQPLGLTTAGFGAPGSEDQIDQPWGHWGMVFTGRPVAPGGFFSRLNPPAFFGPAATARMTVFDWSKSPRFTCVAIPPTRITPRPC